MSAEITRLKRSLSASDKDDKDDDESAADSEEEEDIEDGSELDDDEIDELEMEVLVGAHAERIRQVLFHRFLYADDACRW